MALVRDHMDEISEELFRNQCDWDLVSQYLTGDPAAFETLRYSYHRYLSRIVLKRRYDLIAHSFTELDEILDKTWLKALLKINSHDFDNSKKFSSWLVGILLNVLQGRDIRPIQAVPARNREDQTNVIENVPFSGLSPAHEAWNADLHLAIHDCLTGLPKDDYSLARMFYVEELKKAEMARKLGCSDVAVGKRLKRISSLLIECLKKKGYFEDDIASFK